MKSKLLFLIFILPFNINASEIKKQLIVSATVIYDCTKNDPKAQKYCSNYVIKQENNTIIYYY